MIKLPTPTAARLASAIRIHGVYPLLSRPFTPALFVGVVVAAEEVGEVGEVAAEEADEVDDVGELLLAALGGPMLPP
jgi:hypothetical protein